MSTWHLALRWLGLRDRAARKEPRKTAGYFAIVLPMCIAGPVAGVLLANEHWVTGGLLLVGALVLAISAEVFRDLPHLRQLRHRRQDRAKR